MGMGKVKYLQYILYGTVCIVSFLIALICIWWFLEKPYTKEDFIIPAPYVVMAGLTSTGEVYYADIDATISPKWIYTRISGSIGDIAGSYGQIYTVIKTGSSVSYGPYDSSTQAAFTDGKSLTTLSIDDDGSIVGCYETSGSNVFYSSAASSRFTNLSSIGAISSSQSGGQMFSIGTDNALYYSPSNKTSVGTVKITVTGASAWKDVSFDGAVCALKTDGTLWCADTNVGASTANWKQQGTQKFSQISLKGGRIVGVGTDGKVYYSNTYQNPTWTQLPLAAYTPMGVPDSTKTGNLAFTKVILMYPSLDARRKRFLGTATACNPDEQLIGAFCYQACASGRAAVGIRCPYRRHQTPAIASCAAGDEFLNGSCYKPCPTGYTANGDKCVGATSDKGGVNAVNQGSISPAKYACPANGTISARYVRIRPTMLSSNNKLCLSQVVVKGANGEIFSLPSGTPAITSTIGYITGSWIYGSSKSMPILAIKTVGTLKLYVAESGGNVLMVANDTAGTAKYAAGKISTWKDSYWTNGTSAGSKSTGQYILTLAAKPVATYSTDGTCSDNPIGGSTNAAGASYCSGAYSSYTSSSKYDTETDGGVQSRSAKVYWEVDLGGIQDIKTIDITGCTDLDSIRGMRVELLYKDNLPSTVPLVTRTLGPTTTRQTLTFNYSSKEPGIDNRCYDDCPPVNGNPTGYGGDETCISAPNGITSRSVTTPLALPAPICKIPRNEDGTPFTIPGPTGAIGDWIIDPDNTTQVLACKPGSTLVPLKYQFTYPGSGGHGANYWQGKPDPVTADSTINVNLQNTSGVPYTNPNSKFYCVNSFQNACTQYPGFVYDGPTKMCVNRNVLSQVVYSTPTNCTSCPIYQGAGYDGSTVNAPVLRSVTNMPVSNGCSFSSKLKCGPMQNDCPYCAITVYYNAIDVFNSDAKQNYKIPSIPDADASLPTTHASDCKCYNGDGTINRTAYIYKNKCIQCSGKKDIFYPTGAASSTSTWSTEQKNTWMSLFDMGIGGNTMVAVDPANHEYAEFEDAKAGCEANVLCKGITKTYDFDGYPYYSLRAGKPRSTADEAGGSKGSGGSLIDRTHVTPDDSSWVRTEAGSGRNVTLEALHTGFTYSTRDIPRSFADDYVGSFAKATPPTTIEAAGSSSFDVAQMMSAAVLQAQSAWASFQNSVQNDTYYTLVGVERRLAPDKVSTEYGICVGPCDKAHEYHDELQLLYDSAASSKTAGSPAYILYGTTCHSNTFTRFPKPSIPAGYTAQVGAACPENYQESDGRCIRQCGADTVDNGSSCTTNSKDRAFVKPDYTCPSSLTKVDNVCVHACGPGFTSDGDYCQAEVKTATPPNTINCTRTDSGYTAGSGSGKVNKWLCDSRDDLTALLIDPNTGSGITGTSSYTKPDDIVCYSDDATTAMYYCSSIDEFVNSVEDTERTDLSTSCDTLKKSYFDLSNNLTILMSAQTSATSTSAQVSAIETTLETIIGQICPTSGASGTASASASCTDLNRLLSILKSTVSSNSSGSSPLSAITTPLRVGTQSRDNLIGMLSKYKCCSLEAPGTTYPWCPTV